jgi:hypothetical protein
VYRKMLVVAIFASICGCAFNTGNKSGNLKIENATQESLLEQFALDVATRDDVVRQFGPPDKKVLAGSYEVWTYSYSSSASIVVALVSVPIGEHKAARFYFDSESGLLKKIDIDAHRG